MCVCWPLGTYGELERFGRVKRQVLTIVDWSPQSKIVEWIIKQIASAWSEEAVWLGAGVSPARKCLQRHQALGPRIATFRIKMEPQEWPLPAHLCLKNVRSTGAYVTCDPSCPCPYALNELSPLLTWQLWVPQECLVPCDLVFCFAFIPTPTCFLS